MVLGVSEIRDGATTAKIKKTSHLLVPDNQKGLGPGKQRRGQGSQKKLKDFCILSVSFDI